MILNDYLHTAIRPNLLECINISYDRSTGAKVVYKPGDAMYIDLKVIRRFNDNPIQVVLNSASGDAETRIEPRSGRQNTKTAVLWSFVGYRDFELDVDAYGLSAMWFVNFECVGANWVQAHRIGTELLDLLNRHKCLVSIFSRYDEPLDPDSQAGQYRSHNVSVTMPGLVQYEP